MNTMMCSTPSRQSKKRLSDHNISPAAKRKLRKMDKSASFKSTRSRELNLKKKLLLEECDRKAKEISNNPNSHMDMIFTLVGYDYVQIINMAYTARYFGKCDLCEMSIIPNRHDIVPLPNENRKSWVHSQCWQKRVLLPQIKDALKKRKLLENSTEPNEETESSKITKAIRDEDESLVVNAVAGSGKTTLLTDVMKELKKFKSRIICLTFNKSARIELQRRGCGEYASTFHSKGLELLNDYFNRRSDYVYTHAHGKLQEFNTSYILQEILQEEFSNDEKKRTKTLSKKWRIKLVSPIISTLVSLCKKNALGCNEELNVKSIRKIFRKYNFEYKVRIKFQKAKHTNKSQDELIQIANETIETIILPFTKEVIDKCVQRFKEKEEMSDMTFCFDDMEYIPIRLQLAPRELYDYVLVDEAQDTNPSRLEFIKLCRSPIGKVLAVGDTNQSIYGFLGAMSDSLGDIADAFDSRRDLPLTVSWRCPKLVVELVNRFLNLYKEIMPDKRNQMRAREGAIDGLILGQSKSKRVTFASKYKKISLKPKSGKDHVIICRLNSPLCHLLLELAKRNLTCHMIGRPELGIKMIKIVNACKLNYNSSAESLTKLLKSMSTNEEKLLYDDTTQEVSEKAKSKIDLINCILGIIKHHQRQKGKGITVCDVIDRLKEFRDGRSPEQGQKGDVIELCLEWDRVYILQPDDLSMDNIIKYGQDWEKRQEIHCSYVAFTRTKSELIFLKQIDDFKFSKLWENDSKNKSSTNSDVESMDSGSEDESMNSDSDVESIAETNNDRIIKAAEKLEIKIPDSDVAASHDKLITYRRYVTRERNKLLKRYHPDKQNAYSDSERLSIDDANEKTSQINIASKALIDWCTDEMKNFTIN